MYTSIEAAAEIGTTPRLLRRFLRDSGNSWNNAGIGGRYLFTESDVKRLNKEFHLWHKSKPAKEKVDPYDHLDGEPLLTVEEMLGLNKNPKRKAEVLKLHADRLARLDARMRECDVLPKPQFFDEEVDA